jgi:hypothetical protein
VNFQLLNDGRFETGDADGRFETGDADGRFETGDYDDDSRFSFVLPPFYFFTAIKKEFDR